MSTLGGEVFPFSENPTWQDALPFSSFASDFSFLRFRDLEPSPGLERSPVGRPDRRDRTDRRVSVLIGYCVLAGRVFLRCCKFPEMPEVKF